MEYDVKMIVPSFPSPTRHTHTPTPAREIFYPISISFFSYEVVRSNKQFSMKQISPQLFLIHP